MIFTLQLIWFEIPQALSTCEHKSNYNNGNNSTYSLDLHLRRTLPFPQLTWDSHTFQKKMEWNSMIWKGQLLMSVYKAYT